MDSHAWDQRYDGSDLVWSAGPNQFVSEHAAGLTPGRSLDLACGEGRNALWLAEQGWESVGVDFSAVAIEKARRIADHRGIDVDLRVLDATDGDGLAALGRFALVVVAYLQLPAADLDTALRHAATLVDDSGSLLVVGHHVDNLERGHGGPRDVAVLHDPMRVAAALEPLVVTRAEEVERRVETDDGPRTALDSLVVAVRSVG